MLRVLVMVLVYVAAQNNACDVWPTEHVVCLLVALFFRKNSSSQCACHKIVLKENVKVTDITMVLYRTRGINLLWPNSLWNVFV